MTQTAPHVVIAFFLSTGVAVAPALTLACFMVATVGWLIGLMLGGAGNDDAA